MSAEAVRLEEPRRRDRHWKRWGPYLSERAWGSVREDYSEYPLRYSRVRNSFAAGLLVTRMLAPS
jgi:hypothetical protein